MWYENIVSSLVDFIMSLIPHLELLFIIIGLVITVFELIRSNNEKIVHAKQQLLEYLMNLHSRNRERMLWIHNWRLQKESDNQFGNIDSDCKHSIMLSEEARRIKTIIYSERFRKISRNHIVNMSKIIDELENFNLSIQMGYRSYEEKTSTGVVFGVIHPNTENERQRIDAIEDSIFRLNYEMTHCKQRKMKDADFT